MGIRGGRGERRHLFSSEENNGPSEAGCLPLTPAPEAQGITQLERPWLSRCKFPGGMKGGGTPASSSRAPGLSQGLGEKMPNQVVDLGPRCCSIHHDDIDCQILRYNPFNPNNNITKDTVVVIPVFHMGKLRLGEVAKVTN